MELSKFYILLFTVPPADGSLQFNDQKTDFSKNQTSGVVFIAHKGIWGGFCGRGFNSITGRILCRQLGYSDYLSNVCCYTNSSSTNKVWVTKVVCDRDNITTISQCTLTYGDDASLCGNIRITCKSKSTIYFNSE